MSAGSEIQALTAQIDALAEQFADVQFWSQAINCLGGTPFVPTIVAPEPTDYWTTRNAYLERMHGNIPDGSVLFFGDSLTEAMAVSDVTPYGVNMGIGGQSMRSQLKALSFPNHPARRAGACVLLSGICDMGNTAAYTSGAEAAQTVNYMYSQLANWMTGRWVIVKLLPVDTALCPTISNVDIGTVNANLQTLFGNREGVALVDATLALAPFGQLENAFHIGDGQHPNAAGYSILKPLIRNALNNILEACEKTEPIYRR